MPLRIAICCCNYLFGEGIKELVEKDELDIEKAINCADPKEVIETKPDLLITDFNTLSSLFLDTLFEHNVIILLLGTSCFPRIENKRLIDFFSKGLVGILSPKTKPAQLKKAIKRVVSGELWLNHKKVRDILSKIKDLKTEDMPSFTKREIEIIKLICRGYRNKEIVQSLNLSEQSVKIHLHKIYKKVDVTDRLQLAIYALKNLLDYLD